MIWGYHNFWKHPYRVRSYNSTYRGLMTPLTPIGSGSIFPNHNLTPRPEMAGLTSRVYSSCVSFNKALLTAYSFSYSLRRPVIKPPFLTGGLVSSRLTRLHKIMQGVPLLSYDWSYNHYKWPNIIGFAWGYFTLLIGVISPQL